MGAGLVAPPVGRQSTSAPTAMRVEPVTSIRARIREALPMERAELMRTFVRQQAMVVLRRDAAEPIALDDRLMDFGFDSLMAVQLRGLIGRALGFERPLPATLMFDHPTIDSIARYLEGRLGAESAADPLAAAATPAAQAAPPPGGLSERLASMSDAEVEALLNERLGPA